MSLDSRLRAELAHLASEDYFDATSMLASVRTGGRRRMVLRRAGLALGSMALALAAFLAAPEVIGQLRAEQVNTVDQPGEEEVPTEGQHPEDRSDVGEGSRGQSGRAQSSTDRGPGSTRGSTGGSKDGSSQTNLSSYLIVFEREGEVHVISGDGSGLRHLVAGYAPNWSPDGNRIALEMWRGELHVVNLDGSSHVNLGVEGSQPSWSPDGRKLVFNWPYDSSKVGCRFYDDAPGALGPECGIGVVNADGTGLRWLGTGRWPEWGPDGRIVFGDGSPPGCHYDAPSASNATMDWAARSGLPACALPVWVMDGDGSGRQRLAAERAIRPNWSPDGKMIAYHTQEGGVFVENLNGTEFRHVAPAGYLDPSWSPSGTWIAMGRTPQNGDASLLGIYVRRIDGSGESQLTAHRKWDRFTDTSF